MEATMAENFLHTGMLYHVLHERTRSLKFNSPLIPT